MQQHAACNPSKVNSLDYVLLLPERSGLVPYAGHVILRVASSMRFMWVRSDEGHWKFIGRGKLHGGSIS